MMDFETDMDTKQEEKQQVKDAFCCFIENLSNVDFDADADFDFENGERTVDLLTLCTEFIALKTEVKQESRQFKGVLDNFKGALESFKEVFNTLQNSHDVLANELTIRRQEQQFEVEKQQRAILKPVLLDLIDLRDRLEIGVIHIKTYQPNWFSRVFKQEPIFINSMGEGQAMTLRRVDQLLSNYEVKALNTIESLFDPHSMRAAELVCRPELPNGIVVSEARKGFMWKDEILRIAEVTVNKTI